MSTFFQILGSLGLFLFGMKLMSDALQKSTGDKLRSIMQSMTGNRFKGLFSGLIVTTAVQSSTATTIMVVGFVNAGILKLREAIGVIMGANLGTTATAWIIALFGFKFDMAGVCLPMIGIGVVFLFFFKKQGYKNSGEFLIGLGLLFFGLVYLKDSVPDLQAHPELFEWIKGFTGFGFGSVLIFLTFGIILTLVVQSSSVAVAITMSMLSKGWFGEDSLWAFTLAAAIVLGENIGTTMTAIVAAVPGSRNAKRAAFTHLVFNVLGVIWVLCVFGYFINALGAMLVGFDSVMEFFGMGRGDLSGASDDNHIKLALFHTMFNLTNICVLIGFVPWIEKLACFVIPVSKSEEQTPGPTQRLEYLTNNFKEVGELALYEGQREVVKLAEMSQDMFVGFVNVFQHPEQDLSNEVNRLRDLEKDCDKLSYALTQFFVHCSAHEISDKSTKLVVKNMLIVAELEDLSDCCYRLLTMAKKRYRKQTNYSMMSVPAFVEFCVEVQSFLALTKTMLEKQYISKEDLADARKIREKLNFVRKMIRREAVANMETTGSATRGGVLFIEILGQCEKVGAHAMNVLQALESPEMLFLD